MVAAMTYIPADLETAERHVTQGQRHVVEQEELVSRLLLKGLPTEAADELLSTYRSLLEQHQEHRDLIEAQLRDRQASEPAPSDRPAALAPRNTRPFEEDSREPPG